MSSSCTQKSPQNYSNNSPLFQYKAANKWLPLTDSQVSRHFKTILTRLHLQNTHLTFHAFRRSGASFAFNSNVPLQDIQRHGTWTLECVWRYITLDHNASDQVVKNFQNHLYHLYISTSFLPGALILNSTTPPFSFSFGIINQISYIQIKISSFICQMYR